MRFAFQVAAHAKESPPMRMLPMLLLAASFPCLLPQRALAASVQARERAARKACLTGNPEKGVAILADLFIDTDDLSYIFNQGRCFEQSRRYEDAIGRFREYLIKGDKLKPDERADAEKHIAACRSYLGKPETPEPVVQEPRKPVIPPPSPAVEPNPTLPAMPPATVARSANEAPPDGKAGSGLRIAGITVAAVGAAALVSGVVLNLKANSLANDLEKPENYSRSTDSTRKDYKTLSWVGYGAGAALLATGAAMYYVGWSNGQASQPTVTVAPVLSTNTIGTVLRGAF
jgi:hypothetical protein